MNFKKIIALIASVFLILNIVGCKSTTENTSSGEITVPQTEKHKNYLTLLYSMSDSFNPYTVSCVSLYMSLL